MILSDNQVLEMWQEGDLVIDPFDPEQLQAASYDVRLHKHFKTINPRRTSSLDPRRQPVKFYESYENVDEDDPFVLHPGEFALASTLERFSFPADVVGRLEGKSSLGRLGLIVHATAGFFDPGFTGHATLELHNLLRVPVELYYRMPIAQMSFLRVEGQVSRLYQGKYQDQGAEPQPSEYWRNFDADASA